MPLRWLAPEAWADRTFTHMTDVWAFGVTIWEILSYGEIPYKDIKNLYSLPQKLKKGHRLERPELCNEEFYQEILLKCWSQPWTERISFQTLFSILKIWVDRNDHDRYLKKDIRKWHGPSIAINDENGDVIFDNNGSNLADQQARQNAHLQAKIAALSEGHNNNNKSKNRASRGSSSSNGFSTNFHHKKNSVKKSLLKRKQSKNDKNKKDSSSSAFNDEMVSNNYKDILLEDTTEKNTADDKPLLSNMSSSLNQNGHLTSIVPDGNGFEISYEPIIVEGGVKNTREKPQSYFGVACLLSKENFIFKLSFEAILILKITTTSFS